MATKGSERAAPVTRFLPHVVIVGGGFGGLYGARALAGRQVRVTLLDRRNHHLFQPLLYQVATAALNASDIAAPLRSVLRKAHNVTVLLASVERGDLAAHRLVLDRGEIGYDALVLAAGASHSYFGHDEWEMLAPGLKTLEDALEIRRRVRAGRRRATGAPHVRGGRRRSHRRRAGGRPRRDLAPDHRPRLSPDRPDQVAHRPSRGRVAH